MKSHEEWYKTTLHTARAAIAHLDGLALEQCGHWVELETLPDGDVLLQYGTVHTNGDRERAIGSRRYFQKVNGVDYTAVAYA